MSGILGGLGGLFSSIFGGGSSGGSNPLAGLLSGALTSQRVPGQTTAGEYTPPAGGYGTYNYIPTGATQIDPALISQILSGLGTNQNAAGSAGSMNQGLLGQSLYNPANQGLTNAGQSAGEVAGNAAGYDVNAANNLGNNAGSLLNMYQALMGSAASNPFASSMVQGAQQVGAGMQSAGAGLSAAATPAIGGVNNQFNPQQLSGAQTAGSMLQGTGGQTYGQGQQISGAATGGLPAASQILNTAFDPQQSLYNQQATQLNDQLGSYMANSGLTSSGAGAGIAANALGNFDINWQNNQLGRQAQGLGAYGSAVGSAGQNATQASNLQQQGAGQFATGAALPAQTLNQQTGTQFNLAQQGAGALGSTYGLQQAGNTLPYQTQNQTTSDYAGYLGQASTGASNAANVYNTGGNLQNSGVANQYNTGALPYQASSTINNNNNQQLSSYLANATSGSNLTNQSTQQLLSYLQSVMTGSNNAANAASGAQGNTNTANANASAALNPLVNSGLNGLSSLFSNLFGSSSGGGSSGGMIYT